MLKTVVKQINKEGEREGERERERKRHAKFFVQYILLLPLSVCGQSFCCRGWHFDLVVNTI